MRLALPIALLVTAALAGCAAAPGQIETGGAGGPATRNPRAISTAGSVAHGEFVTVPLGTVGDWSLLVSPREMGAEEPRSEHDNRLLAMRVFATPVSDVAWQVTAQYRFAYSTGNMTTDWVNGTANYLLVRR